MLMRRITMLAAVLCTAASAGATTTYSPPVRSDMGDNLGCELLNLGSSDISVQSDLEDGLGTVVDSQTFSIPAGQGRLMARSNTAIFGGFCRFVFDGDARQVRGYISLEDAGGSNTRLLYPAEPIAGSPPVGTTTFTPPVRSSEGDNLGCELLNLDDAPIQVSSQLHDGLGGISDAQAFVVPAGQGRLMARSSAAIFGGYCSFTFEGDPTAIRGFISLEDAGGSNTRLLYPAEPATATVEPAGCCGDCNGNLEVSINELITAVNNALGVCPTN
jgi:hypothetical protein